MVNQKKLLVTLVVLLVLVIGVSFSVYALSYKEHRVITGPGRFYGPTYDCPEDMPPYECAQLKLTCGNGVIDPGEDCHNCGFDAGCGAGLICGRVNGTQDYACKYPVGLCITGPAG